jgi:hypothetical protein
MADPHLRPLVAPIRPPETRIHSIFDSTPKTPATPATPFTQERKQEFRALPVARQVFVRTVTSQLTERYAPHAGTRDRMTIIQLLGEIMEACTAESATERDRLSQLVFAEVAGRLGLERCVVEAVIKYLSSKCRRTVFSCCMAPMNELL